MMGMGGWGGGHGMGGGPGGAVVDDGYESGLIVRERAGIKSLCAVPGWTELYP